MIYHPWEDKTHNRFNDTLKDLLEKVRDRTEIIFGADINAKIGIRDRNEYSDVLGPNGIELRNEKGKNLLGIYANRNLMVENTFFTHDNYATYHCKKYDTPSIHDVIVVSKGLHKRVRNCKATNDGAESDHKEVKLSLAMTSIKFKNTSQILTG